MVTQRVYVDFGPSRQQTPHVNVAPSMHALVTTQQTPQWDNFDIHPTLCSTSKCLWCLWRLWCLWCPLPAPAALNAIGARHTSAIGPRPHPGGTGRMRLKIGDETRRDGTRRSCTPRSPHAALVCISAIDTTYSTDPRHCFLSLCLLFVSLLRIHVVCHHHDRTYLLRVQHLCL